MLSAGWDGFSAMFFQIFKEKINSYITDFSKE